MGCGASTDGAGQRRPGRARGHSEAEPNQDQLPAAAVGPGRRRGRKVVPEPNEGDEPTDGLPSSPSFRFYCEKASKVDAIVAAADADGGASYGSGRVTETPQAIIPHRSTGSSASKDAKGWLKFRDMGIVAVVYSLFGRRRTAASPPPAKSAASPPAVP